MHAIAVAGRGKKSPAMSMNMQLAKRGEFKKKRACMSSTIGTATGGALRLNGVRTGTGGCQSSSVHVHNFGRASVCSRTHGRWPRPRRVLESSNATQVCTWVLIARQYAAPCCSAGGSRRRAATANFWALRVSQHVSTTANAWRRPCLWALCAAVEEHISLRRGRRTPIYSRVHAPCWRASQKLQSPRLRHEPGREQTHRGAAGAHYGRAAVGQGTTRGGQAEDEASK